MKRSWVISITFFLIAGDVFAARSKGDYNFDKQGIQIGQHLPHLSAHLQNGKSVWLSNYYAERLTLFVCESLTCPVARRKHPGLKEIAKRFGDRIDIVVFYTTEAHPQGDPSPLTPRAKNGSHGSTGNRESSAVNPRRWMSGSTWPGVSRRPWPSNPRCWWTV